MSKQRGELIALSGTNANAAGHTLTLQVLRAGEFVDMNGKPFTLDAAALDEYVANSNARLQGEQLPVEIGHPDDAGAPAAAWYKRFFKKIVDGVEWICAEVELTTVGAEALAQDLYKYFSAELYTSTKEITGGGFVNRPAVSGQQVVGTLALSAYLHPKESRMKFSDRIKRMLGLLQLELSQEETQNKLWEALRAKYADPLDEYGMAMPWLKATFDDHVIVEKNGDLFSIAYTLDGDTVTLGEPVAVEVVYQPKPTAEATPAAELSKPVAPDARRTDQGGERTMNEQERIEAARKEERENLAGELRDQDAKIQAAREDERKRVLAAAARTDAVRQLAATLTTGKFAFPQKPADLEAVLLQLSDEDRALITPVLEKIKASGLVNLSEEGHSRDLAGKKELSAGYRRLLAGWIEKKKTVAEFFQVNPELGKADEYDLSAFQA